MIEAFDSSSSVMDTVCEYVLSLAEDSSSELSSTFLTGSKISDNRWLSSKAAVSAEVSSK